MKKSKWMLMFAMIGCAGTPIANFENTVQKRAAFDFSCPESYVSVIADGLTEYSASGCGKKARYQVKCSIGPCVAKPIE